MTNAKVYQGFHDNKKFEELHGRPQKFFQGGQRRHFAYISQVANADDQVRNQAGGTRQFPPRNFQNFV